MINYPFTYSIFNQIVSKFILVFCFIISVISPQIIWSNAAQPGIWNAGGTTYTMLYPEDAASFKKVQMQRECIYIQLYKGFAVVKGTYVFKNTTAETLKFKMGYPVNGIYSGGETYLNQITLDSLSKFKIKAGNKWLNLLNEKHTNSNYPNINTFSSNWKVWQMQFLPHQTQNVTVYFIVNTNNAKIRKGYNVDKKNAFIYLLESGNVWKGTIEKAQFYIQLMQGLKPENVDGLSSHFSFKFNKEHQIFAGNKYNFAPTPHDNLIITYNEYDKGFLFKNTVNHADYFFNTIDSISQIAFDSLTYDSIKIGSPYQVKNTKDGYFVNILFILITYLPYVLVFLLIMGFFWFIKKRFF